ncbi:MAG TPA: hypothetical protein VFV38_36925 [Ktedonobacteraceae bacterium]|nr:hypothetical protein [Ktedonobacteraceae bacterium]
MALIEPQAAAVLSLMRKCVFEAWTLFNYRWCPRDLTQNNLLVLDRDLRSFLEVFDKYSELKSLLPSIDAVQDALQDTIRQVNFAADTFDPPSSLGQREQFYAAYIDIFEYLSRVQASLDETSILPYDGFPPPLASDAEPEATAKLSQYCERVKKIWAIFDHEYSPRAFGQIDLLFFEKELREMLESIVISPPMKSLLWSADAFQSALRTPILHLNFAADILGLPVSLEQREKFYQVHKDICAGLVEAKKHARLRN